METWIALKKLIDDLESATPYGKVDSISQRLLEWIFVRVQKRETLFIQEIIMTSEIASPATLHKSIAMLEQRGLIHLIVDPLDSRRRIVQVSSQGERLMKELSRGVTSWANSLSRAIPKSKPRN